MRAAILPRRSTRAKFTFNAPGSKRGMRLRRSELTKVASAPIAPVKNPFPSGLKGTR